MTEEELPSGWAMARLGDFLIERGQGIDPATAPDEKFELYSVPSFETGHAEMLTGAEIGSSKQIVEPNTVLICKINPRINRAWRVREASGRRQIASTEWVCFPPSDAIEPDYLRLYLSREPIRAFLALNVSGVGGSLMRVRPSTLAPYPLPIAPLNEQRRIVERIDELFSQIEAGEAALAQAKRLLDRYRQAVLKAAVTGELTRDWRERHQAEIEPATHLLTRILQARREAWEKAELEKLRAKGKPPKDDSWKKKYKEPEPPDTTDLSELPDGWVWASIAQVSHFVTSGSRGWKEFYSSEGAIFVRAQNIKTNSLVLDDVAYVSVLHNSEGTRTKIELNDILITITGANVTKTALVYQPIQDAYVNQHIALVRPVAREIADFMHISLISKDHGRAQLLSRAYGAGRPGLGLTDVEHVIIPLAPAVEAIQVTDLCRAITSELDAAEYSIAAEVRRAAALRQAILTAAFAGKLVPQDPADEPAAALLDRIRAERPTTPTTKPRRGRPPKPAAIAAQ